MSRLTTRQILKAGAVWHKIAFATIIHKYVLNKSEIAIRDMGNGSGKWVRSHLLFDTSNKTNGSGYEI